MCDVQNREGLYEHLIFMADLQIPNVGVLSITPLGLKNDTFCGWTMRSDVVISTENSSISLGKLKSGPSFRSGISKFINELQVCYRYAPNFDDDLPSTVMDVELKRLISKISISIGRDYYCSLDEDSTLKAKINSEMHKLSKLGEDNYDVTTDEIDNLMLVRSCFEAIVAEEQMLNFLNQLGAELDQSANS
jgi:hypothetical protein